MTIQYDDETKTAMDTGSGMAVQSLGNDYPLEKQAFFSLLWKGERRRFEVHYDAGFSELDAANPGLDPAEVLTLMEKRNTIDYYVTSLPGFPEVRIGTDQLNTFLELFGKVLRSKHETANVHIVFAPAEIDKALHRDVRYPPLRTTL